MSTYEGSCLCGQVQFVVRGSFQNFFLCHCKYCQKDTGSAHAANLFAPGASLEWAAGESQVKTFTLPSTRHTKSFCQECGSAMPNVQMNGQLVMVPAGSLDCAVDIKPQGRIFCSSKANWDEDLKDIPKFPTFPS